MLPATVFCGVGLLLYSLVARMVHSLGQLRAGRYGEPVTV